MLIIAHTADTCSESRVLCGPGGQLVTPARAPDTFEIGVITPTPG